MINLNEVSPNKVTEEFKHINHNLAVRVKDSWAYYPMKVDKEDKGFLNITKTPAVLNAGILIQPQRTYYEVSVNDLLRGKVNVRNACRKPGSTTNSESRGDKGDSSIELTTKDLAWAAECEAANVAFDEQQISLQNT